MRPVEWPLVGRRDEVAWLDGLLAAVEAGQGGVAVLTGPAGIGKTRLLDELARRHQPSTLVLRGRASEFERTFPFGVVIDVLDDYLKSMDGAALDALDPTTRGELALIFPALRAEATHDIGQPAADDRVRAYFAIRALIELIGERGPLVLLLDDVHWADRGSVELIAHLIRRPPRRPVLIVVAYRDRQVDPTLSAAISRAVTEGGASVRPVGPLSPAESTELAGQNSDLAELEWHGLSGGNPLLVLELARSGGAVDSADGLPSAVASTIGRELEPLSSASRALIEAAACLGDPFDHDLAVEVAGIDHSAGLTALDEIAVLGLVRSTEVPRRFAFRHPLVRHAIHDGLPPGRRLAAHERAAAVLLVRGSPSVERAHHVEHSARPGDEDAIAVLTTAAHEVAARAPASAVRWLRSAQRLLPADAPPQARLDLLAPLAPLLLSLGELPEAYEVVLSALALVPDDDPVQRTPLVTTCAALEQLLGHQESSSARLEALRADLPTDAVPEKIAVSVALVMDGFYRRRHDLMWAHGRAAVEAAERLGDRLLLALSHASLAFAGALSGAIAEAQEHRDVAAELTDALSDEDVVRRLDVLGMLAAAECYLDRYPEAVAHGTRGVRIGRATGTTATAPTLVPILGTALWLTGRVDDSIALLDEAVEAARASSDQQVLAWSLFNLGYAQAKGGDTPAGLVSTSESLQIARGLSDTVIMSWAAAARATALFTDGDAAAALATLLDEAGGPTLENIPGGWRTHYLDLLVAGHLALGDPDAAERSLALTWARAREINLPYSLSSAHVAQSRVLAHRGEHAAAAAELERAIDLAESVAARLDASLHRISLGETLLAAGDTEGAVRALTTAASELDAMGTFRHRDRAERILGRLGHRPHRRTRAGASDEGVGALTARERQIAGLLAERRTNPEIAGELYLSPRTVESHVRNILRKLGVTSRNDVVRVLQTQG